MSGPEVVDRDDGDSDDHDGPLSELTVFAVLGGGLLGLFLGVEWFWMIWVFGFAVVLPVVSILERRFGRLPGGRGRYAPDHHGDARSERSEAEDALETLKRRYAEGEIDEVEFERRLERLMENESIEDVERRVSQAPETRSDDGQRGREREFDLE